VRRSNYRSMMANRRRQLARDEIVEAASRRERLASAQLQGQQMFVPVGKDAVHGQRGYADHLPAALHCAGAKPSSR